MVTNETFHRRTTSMGGVTFLRLVTYNTAVLSIANGMLDYAFDTCESSHKYFSHQPPRLLTKTLFQSLAGFIIFGSANSSARIKDGFS